MDATASRQGHPRVVLVHDWLTGMRGGEKCLEVLCRRWPRRQALHAAAQARHRHARHRAASAAHQLPRSAYPASIATIAICLPLMPAAAAAWRLPACDLVVSFSHCVAKAARPPTGVPHVCYCFTPMRYAWHMRDAYFGGHRGLSAPPARRRARRPCATGTAAPPRASRTSSPSAGPCSSASPSATAATASSSIRPSIPTSTRPAPVPREDFYLVVSAFAPYKRLDLAMPACPRCGRQLVVIGTGQDDRRLRSAGGADVHFLGWQPDDVIRDHLRRCQALLFPGEEDFGIVPVEALACGAP